MTAGTERHRDRRLTLLPVIAERSAPSLAATAVSGENNRLSGLLLRTSTAAICSSWTMNSAASPALIRLNLCRNGWLNTPARNGL